MKHGSLFNGIGGFQLAAAWMGWQNIFSCEIDDFCNKVTKKHFPDCIQHGDIKTTDFTIYRGRIDIVTGGFPCQPFSVAGNRKGAEDERFLWGEMLRAVKEIYPRYVVAENVPGLLSLSRGLVFEQVCSEMEDAGYQVQPVIIPACAVNAPHKRDRVWMVAHAINSSDRAIGNTFPKENRIPEFSRQAMGTGLSGRAVGDNASNTVRTGKRRDARKKQNEKNVVTITDSPLIGLQGGKQADRGERAKRNDQLPYGRSREWDESWYEVAAKFCRVDDGLPNRIHRLKALGNAIVPQVAYEIFKAIEQTQ